MKIQNNQTKVRYGLPIDSHLLKDPAALAEFQRMIAKWPKHAAGKPDRNPYARVVAQLLVKGRAAR